LHPTECYSNIYFIDAVTTSASVYIIILPNLFKLSENTDILNDSAFSKQFCVTYIDVTYIKMEILNDSCILLVKDLIQKYNANLCSSKYYCNTFDNAISDNKKMFLPNDMGSNVTNLSICEFDMSSLLC